MSAPQPTKERLERLVNLDRFIHEPARLAILTVLNSAEEVEFRFLETITGLSRGNLSSHTAKLEEAGYLDVIKSFRGRRPHTSYRITARGKAALAEYWQQLRSVLPEGAL
jgi:DNA-binding transcriptional ArsR family regulator